MPDKKVNERRGFSLLTNNIIPIVVAIIAPFAVQWASRCNTVETNTTVSRDEIRTMVQEEIDPINKLVTLEQKLMEEYHKDTLELINDLDKKISDHIGISTNTDKIKASQKKAENNLANTKNQLKK